MDPDGYCSAASLLRLRLDDRLHGTAHDASRQITILSRSRPWLRASILLMNRELELLIREVMIQMAVRKQSWQGSDKPA